MKFIKEITPKGLCYRVTAARLAGLGPERKWNTVFRRAP